LLTTSYVAIVGLVLSGCQAIGLLQLELEYLPFVIPIVFVSACAFAALGLCFTALVPTIDHMNLPIFLVVLPLGFVSATYFPLGHPVLAAISTANPVYHLAEGLRGLLLGDGPGYHLAALAGLLGAMLGVLVPLDMRLLRKRVPRRLKGAAMARVRSLEGREAGILAGIIQGLSRLALGRAPAALLGARDR